MHTLSSYPYLVFPLPDGPIIAFTPVFIIPLKQQQNNGLFAHTCICRSGHHYNYNPSFIKCMTKFGKDCTIKKQKVSCMRGHLTMRQHYKLSGCYLVIIRYPDIYIAGRSHETEMYNVSLIDNQKPRLIYLHKRIIKHLLEQTMEYKKVIPRIHMISLNLRLCVITTDII